MPQLSLLKSSDIYEPKERLVEPQVNHVDVGAWSSTELMLPPNNSLEPTWPARRLGFHAILALGWPGGSARRR